MHIVREGELSSIITHLKTKSCLSLDTETTGLRFDQGDRLFSVIIYDGEEAYYFNYNEGDLLEKPLPRETLREIQVLFDTDILYFLHNAKFDLRALAREQISPPRNIYCTMAMARLECNEHLKYSLDACAKRIGFEKSNAVEEFIKKHHLWKWEVIPGKKTRSKKKSFDKVPFDVIAPYACKDAEITFALGQHQQKHFKENIKTVKERSLEGVYKNEKEFTRTCFNLEQRGIRINPDHCEQEIKNQTRRLKSITTSFERHSSLGLTDSAKVYSKVFEGVLDKVLKTPKGNPSFDDESLKTLIRLKDQKITTLCELILDYRDANKKLNTYYRNFLYWADSTHILHPTYFQSGTATGRISVKDPALQTIPKKEESNDDASQVRKSFIPRPGFVFVEMDYKAMEFRMLIDYANEKELASLIRKGQDPHEATAKLVGVSRKEAKTISFGLLYGMGIEKLSASLDVTKEEASRLKAKYFEALPLVQSFNRKTTSIAKERGFIKNWLGRRSYFTDIKWCYKAVNYLIQGGGADVVKVAMNQIESYLKDYKSQMVLQIHDAILFEIHESELNIIPRLKQFMEDAYPHKILPMEVSIEYSKSSWGELIGGSPLEQEARDNLQREDFGGTEVTSKNLVYEGATSSYSGNTGYHSLR